MMRAEQQATNSQMDAMARQVSFFLISWIFINLLDF